MIIIIINNPMTAPPTANNRVDGNAESEETICAEGCEVVVNDCSLAVVEEVTSSVDVRDSCEVVDVGDVVIVSEEFKSEVVV
jgi:hypothetical protein